MADINRDEIERRIRRREPLRDLNLSSIKLDGMSLAGGVFRRCRFNDTTFLSTVLDAVRFEACILGGCDMRGGRACVKRRWRTVIWTVPIFRIPVWVKRVSVLHHWSVPTSVVPGWNE